LIRNEYGIGGTPGWAFDSLVKFNISSIPKGAIINSAKISLFYYKYRDNNPEGRELNVYRVISVWDENTVTWNTQPAYHPTPTTSFPVRWPGGYRHYCKSNGCRRDCKGNTNYHLLACEIEDSFFLIFFSSNNKRANN